MYMSVSSTAKAEGHTCKAAASEFKLAQKESFFSAASGTHLSSWHVSAAAA